MEEIWKEIKDYPGYEVSNMGRVKYEGQLKKLSIDSAGYYKIWLKNINVRKQFLVHRLVLLSFSPPADASLEVNHIDCRKWNNRLSNLEWVTHRQNMEHADKKGKLDYIFRFGEDHPCFGRKMPEESKAKMRLAHNRNNDHPNYILTDQQVYTIKQRRFSGEPLESTANEYNQTMANISLICRGKRRANIAIEYTLPNKIKGRKCKRTAK